MVEDSEFIQLGTAVCVVPVGIRGQGEVSCCLQKARDGQKQGRHVCGEGQEKILGRVYRA